MTGFDEFKKLAAKGYNLIPLYRKVLADFETPLSAYMKLRPFGANLLFESVEGGEKWGRFSIIGIGSCITVKSKDRCVEVVDGGKVYSKTFSSDPLEVLEEIFSSLVPYRPEGLPRVWGGFFGFLSYDVVRFFEPVVTVSRDKEPSFVYDMVFTLPEALVVFDNLRKEVFVVSYALLRAGMDERVVFELSVGRLEEIVDAVFSVSMPEHKVAVTETGQWEANIGDDEFKKMVGKAKVYIKNGDIIQVVLSRRFEKPFVGQPVDVYRALRFVNPSPYMYYLDYGDFVIAGASPEVLVRVEGRKVETRPIAGTRRRGRTQDEDERLEEELLSDEKERAEHIMLVDLARNDVGRVSKAGSVEVTELMVVERYSHVMHIVSNVVGTLRDEKNSFDVLRACFPAGTVSGAPKIRAMQIIDEMEPVDRGVYAGAVGYFSLDGNMDTAIAIRTAVISRDKIYVQAGAGIVADSVPELELKETVNKARAVFRAVELAERGFDL